MMTQDPPAVPPARPIARRAPRSQPLSILEIDGGLLTRETVMQVTGLGKTKLYSMMKAGTFPQSFKVSARSVRWRAEDVRAWIARQGRA